MPTDADDLDHRKRLARLLLEKEQYAEAEKYARQALEIDVKDAEARGVVAEGAAGAEEGRRGGSDGEDSGEVRTVRYVAVTPP